MTREQRKIKEKKFFVAMAAKKLSDVIHDDKEARVIVIIAVGKWMTRAGYSLKDFEALYCTT